MVEGIRDTCTCTCCLLIFILKMKSVVEEPVFAIIDVKMEKEASRELSTSRSCTVLRGLVPSLIPNLHSTKMYKSDL